jgi:hypothetical protein
VAGFTPGAFYAGTEANFTPGGVWYVASGGGDPTFMDGVMTEEEWWWRRRMLYRRIARYKIKKGQPVKS